VSNTHTVRVFVGLAVGSVVHLPVVGLPF